MLSGGLFSTPTQVYMVYEIKYKNFYRIDFLEQGASFQVDTDKVLFSQVRKKNTYVLGNQAIFDEYQRVKETISSTPMVQERINSWTEDGIYETKIVKKDDKRGYSIFTTLHNGQMHDTVLQGDGYTIQSFVIDPNYALTMDPINFHEYKGLTLLKDSVVQEDGGLFYSLDVLKRRYDLQHIEECDYVYADDIGLARHRLKMFDKDPCPFRGFDTETTGLDICMCGTDHMVGIILGHNTTTATYFPFRHDNGKNLPMEFLPELMKVVIKHQDHSIAHNKKFDREVMMFEGYDIHIKWDTLHISIILNPILGKGVHGEKELMYQLDGKHYLELTEIFYNSNKINFGVLPPDIVKYYACPDGTGPIKLLQKFFKELPKYQYKLAELECDLADVKADQEYYGLRVDIKKFERQYRNCDYVLSLLLDAFRKLTASDGNINSTQYLADLLYNKMHCDILLRTKTGQASTSMTAIKKLAKQRAKVARNITQDLVDLEGNVVIKASDLANAQYPALVILAKYKEYNKLKTAFYSRFERTMRTGRIFFWINQTGAATGRQSSPMHQLPPALKACILSDTDDRDFWGPDYSQVELRMIAYLSGEPDLIRLSSDPDNDVHRIIGSLITGKEMWAITAEERSVGKRRNFGVIYSISAMGLAAQIFGVGYTKENVEFCQQQIDEFFHKFKRIDRFVKMNAVKVQKYGYMETEWYHRKRLFTQIFDPNLEPRKKSSIIRMSNNVPVQGTAADLLKVGEVQMSKYIHEKGWDVIQEDGFPLVRNMLSIHDEIIISAHQSIPYEEIIEMITLCMQIPVEGAPPFFVQPARMNSWGDHESDQAAMPIRYRDQVIEEYNKTGKSVFKQGYYKLDMPAQVQQEINDSSEPVPKLVEKYYRACDLIFDHGEEIRDVKKSDIKTALQRYIDSGFTTYRIDNYLDNLNGFRQQQIQNYMEGLISEYGEDYKILGEKIRHPSLTHELLGIYEDKLKKLDMTHEEKITEAARMYLEDRKGKYLDQELEADNVITIDIPRETDKDKFLLQLEPLVQFDRDGNLIYDDAEDELIDDTDYFDDPDPESILQRVESKPEFVWELADTINFDVEGLSKDNINRVLSYVFERRDDNGFFAANLIYNGKLLSTGIKLEKFDIEAANDFIISLQKNSKVLTLAL